MTQTILNNLNNLDINRVLSLKNDCTFSVAKISELVGNLNKKNLGSSKTNDFNIILKEATQEACAEGSLDLTLSKDVKDIIEQFKDFLKKIDEEGSLSEEDMEMIFAQFLAATKTEVSQNSILVEDLAALKEQFKSMFEATTTQAKTAETVSEAVADKISKTLEESGKQDIESVLDEEVLKDLKVESVESESASAGGDSLMQNQSAEEQGIKAMLSKEIESFDTTINKTVAAQNASNAQTKVVDVNPSKILEQVARQLEGLQSNSKVNIVLNPEAIGKVNVQLMSTKEGLTAQFTVNTQEARDLLMKGLDGLKESLLSQGVNVENVSVKMAEAQKSSYNEDWTEQEGSRGGNKNQDRPDREEKEKGLFAKLMAQTFEDENGNV